MLAMLALVVATQVPPAVPPPVDTAKLTRIAVYDIALTDIPKDWGPILGHSITAELRKLQHTSVVSTDEIRTMLEHEANKEMMNCEAGSSSCLAEVADALGVDVLITGTIAKVGEEHLFSLKRIDPSGKTNAQQVTRRFAAGTGEELLGAIGPAVAELFPELPLKKGAVRGVDKEVARRLNPPPLHPWVVIAGGSSAVVLGLAAGGAALINGALASDLATYKTGANPFVQKTFDDKANAVDDTAIATWVAGGVAGVLALSTGVAALFTDFDPPATEGE